MAGMLRPLAGQVAKKGSDKSSGQTDTAGIGIQKTTFQNWCNVHVRPCGLEHPIARSLHVLPSLPLCLLLAGEGVI